MDYICEAGENLALFRVKHTEVREQSLNARVMEPEMMERLAKTIAKEGRLESVPFGVLRDGYIELISGHHRIRSAVTGGITAFLILADTRDLSRDAIVAKQLAHNAIGGFDDPEMRDRLFREITMPDLQLEAFVKTDKSALDELKPPAFDEAKFLWPVLSLVFLPSQMALLEQTVARMAKQVPKDADVVWLVNAEGQKLFADALVKLSRTENIKSNGALVGRMCEIVLDYCAQHDAVTSDQQPGVV